MVERRNESGVSSVLNRTSGLPVVSVDSHMAPRLTDDLREHCSKAYIGRFDQHAAIHEAKKQSGASVLIANVARSKDAGRRQLAQDNLRIEGYYDMQARLRDWMSMASPLRSSAV